MVLKPEGLVAPPLAVAQFAMSVRSVVVTSL